MLDIGQGDDEPCPFAGPGLKIDRAVMFFDHLQTDREPEPRPFAGIFGCKEWLKDMILIFRVNAFGLL